MSGRSVAGLPFLVLAPLCGLCFAAACSSDTTDYFGTPNPTAGKSAAGTGGSAAAGGTTGDFGGTGGSKAGTGSETGGTGGDEPNKGGTGATGGSSSPTGGTPGAGGQGGSTPNQGGTGNGGSTEGGMSGDNGAGETGAGGTNGGTGGTQSPGGEGGMQGGVAGDPGGGGSGGSHVGGTGGTGAGTGGTGGQPGACDNDDDCASSEYCKKSSCNATTGTCTAKPASCTGTDAALNPVCGCDHMTYYTACVAAREGINVASSGVCGSGAATCNRIDGGSSCSPARARAACYRTRSTNSCGTGAPPNEGVCWVLPETCPAEEKLELDCNNGGTPICRGLCDALEKNRPLIRNSSQCD